ncbi:MAG: 2-oxo-3-hexenedioate decarboxylase [Gammaproteobacteria bacterium]|nr:2-oxo-3-hexenedioate decarboxylase [Gammaproteobacteria bacterium]MCP5199621.1 2-oxo-3-hexenedioate decarboxylase [Gammaproteobacteria bacterium]
MTLDEATVEALAARLLAAERERKPITKITDEHPHLDYDDAYAIQNRIRAHKLAAGETIAGLKAGLTSKAKMKQMNVAEPVFGFMTDRGAWPDGGAIERDRYIAPRIEAEIALVTKRDLAGPGCHLAEVLAAIDFVLPAVEVLDSRYENFRFDMVSVVADNTSAAGFVTGGRPRRLREVDLPTLGLVVEKNGQVVEVGAGAAVLGHPAESIVMLANNLARRGEHIPAGSFIMTGGITAAVAVDRGDAITVRFQDLGNLSLRFA